MAELWLTAVECKRDKFPPVCVVCGGRADRDVERTLVRRPWWAIPLVAAAVAGYVAAVALAPRAWWLHTASRYSAFAAAAAMLAATRAVRFAAPVCGRHDGHWRQHAVAFWLWLAGTAVLVVNEAAFRDDLKNAALVRGLRMAIGGLLVAGAVALIAWQRRLVRPAEVTDDGVRLVGVSRAFADAVDADRRAARARRRVADGDDDRE